MRYVRARVRPRARLRRVMRVAQRSRDGDAAWPNPGRMSAARAAEVRLAADAAAGAFEHCAPPRGRARIFREYRMGSLRANLRAARGGAHGHARVGLERRCEPRLEPGGFDGLAALLAEALAALRRDAIVMVMDWADCSRLARLNSHR